ncbi:MAG: 50S ribosomal protein L3 [Methylococcaceae bacterium]|nr:50S ribosomal protein L3 [Methylococcaceae bacterium]MDP3904075.1 50S ribosomal protein L3 [Methylococcaceae bacterium]
MSIGLIGRKSGMTRIFTEDGTSVPVTVIEVEINRITQVKTLEKDGYSSIQVTVGEKKPGTLNKAIAGHYISANVPAGRGLWEFRLDSPDDAVKEIGTTLELDLFSIGQRVDVSGKSIGKGFAGGVKRHHFSMQDATHGNSLSHRVLGSIGMCQTPGRVFKGKKMAGHLGAVKRTVQNLTIHAIDLERNLILVKGAVPGAKGGDLIITPAIKQKNKG